MFTTTTPPLPRQAPRPTPEQADLNPWLLWRIEEAGEPERLSIAELAECRCPDLCDRDHVNE